MPVLLNPRHEAFAQAILAGINGKTQLERAQSTAYRKAYPSCAPGNSAESAASRLLRAVKPIGERIRELQAIAAEEAGEDADKIVRELNEVRTKGINDKAYAAAVSAIMGKAKVLGIVRDTEANGADARDFAHVTSMHDIGRKLLQQVGLRDPDDASIQDAIAANNALVAALESIRDRAQRLTLSSISRSSELGKFRQK